MMADGLTPCYGPYFDKKFSQAAKKHRCLERDLDDIRKTILTSLEQTPQTEGPIPLGAEYSSYKVFKTRMMVTEIRKKCARVVWHFCNEKKQVLFMDIYLKNMQENHDEVIICNSLAEYYA